MKKLLLCTLIMSLWTLGNVMPKLLAPESNSRVKELDKKIEEKQKLVNSLSAELKQKEDAFFAGVRERELRTGAKFKVAVPREIETLKEEIRSAKIELDELNKQREKLLKQLNEESAKRIKEGKEKGIAY